MNCSLATLSFLSRTTPADPHQPIRHGSAFLCPYCVLRITTLAAMKNCDSLSTVTGYMQE